MAAAIGNLALYFGGGIAAGVILWDDDCLLNALDFFCGNIDPHKDLELNHIKWQYPLSESELSSHTIVTSSVSGASKYGVVTIVLVVGYGYSWWKWKGYKLSDMMFATKRGLSGVSKQLYSSIVEHLSSRLDRVDSRRDVSMENTASVSTRVEEVSGLRGIIDLIGTDVQTVHQETKISSTRNETSSGHGKPAQQIKIEAGPWTY